VPDLPYEELQGVESTRLGFRHRSEPLVPMEDPQGKTIYWIGPAGEGPGTDFEAVERGAVAVTPLKVDLTRHEALPDLKTWLAS
jgi:5'-nucleotidase